MRQRLLIISVALALVTASCGDDGADKAEGDATSTTTTTLDDGDSDDPDDDADGSNDGDAPTTTAGESTSTTTTSRAPSGPTGVIAEGTVTTGDGLTVDWQLSADVDELCFTTSLAHTDPAEQSGLGSGQDDCVSPEGGLDDMDSGLSVDVGTVDGEKRIGYLWGRVDPRVIRLTIEHGDGSLTSVDLLDGPTEVKVFAYVVDVTTIPPVIGLDAISGEQIEGSANIRGFLRAGPTYPEVAPPTTTQPPDYPTN